MLTFIVAHPFQSKIAQFQARERRNSQLFQALLTQKWAILAKPAGRGGFCLCHPGCSLPMITLLRSHQGASGKIRLARVGDNECQHDLERFGTSHITCSLPLASVEREK
ncbi:hypothetical protein ACFQFQ_02930 [Sulfitobacter porphyrae]|uniref:Uncharacterized protein n=1 Tax=Sulfitobacter porphyrae TaxID=1246864 RepID=A0ABW2AZH5_9RHOB